jgi:multidrug efflux pump subunit AcrA (membrane-fusion protein)
MRALGLRIIFEILLGIVVATSLVIILRQSRRIAEYQRRQEADSASLKLLREAWRQRGLQALPPETIEKPTGENESAGVASREATIERLDHELAEAHAASSALQAQLNSVNDQNTQAQATARDTLQKQQADSQAQLDDLQKKLTAALTESDIARQRALALEADNAKLKTDNDAFSSKGGDTARIMANLEDIGRRRDAYLTSILRSYRDITSDFRAMTGMLDMSHDANHEPGGGACGGEMLGRIQTAVSSAEDDLRQITELNDRAQKLEKQLPKK